MAITQQNIIDVIPLTISNDDFTLLLSLRALAYYGWGYSKLYTLLNKLIDLVTGTGEEEFSFDHKKLTTKKIECKKCSDTKVKTPCLVCSVNSETNS